MLRRRKSVRLKTNIHHIEPLETRQLMSSSIAGTLWNDTNANKLQDAAEAGLSGWTVYLDQNRNR